MTNPSSMHKTGHSKPVHWDNPVEWDGEEGGRGVWNGEHMYTHSWFMSMYGKKPPQYYKVLSLQLKYRN